MNNKEIKAFIKEARKLAKPFRVTDDSFRLKDIDPDDTLDFLDAGGSAPHGFEEFMSSVDVVVLGRRTFDVVAKYGHFGLYGKRRVVVLSFEHGPHQLRRAPLLARGVHVWGAFGAAARGFPRFLPRGLCGLVRGFCRVLKPF